MVIKMAKRNRKKDYQKKAERRQRQYDLCHSAEAMEKARMARHNVVHSDTDNKDCEIALALSQNSFGTITNLSKRTKPADYYTEYSSYGINEKTIREVAQQAFWTVVVGCGTQRIFMVSDPIGNTLEVLDIGFIYEMANNAGYKKDGTICVINNVPSINDGDLVVICDEGFSSFVDSEKRKAKAA